MISTLEEIYKKIEGVGSRTGRNNEMMMSTALTASAVAAMETCSFFLHRSLDMSLGSGSGRGSSRSERFFAEGALVVALQQPRRCARRTVGTGLKFKADNGDCHNLGKKQYPLTWRFRNLAGRGGRFRMAPSSSCFQFDSKSVGASKFLVGSNRTGRDRSCCRAKNDFFGNGETEDEEAVIQKPSWPVLERWDIPWDVKTTSLGMVAWLLSFLLTGLVVSVVAAQFGIGRRQYMSLDDQAVYILIHQLAQTIAGLSIINISVNNYKPLPAGLFKFDLKSPLDLERGWLLWGILGLVCSGVAVVAASYISAAISGQPASRDDTDALVQLLPIIGASPLSTASLIGVTGVLAPLLEETVFRGFLMTSLTKWMPTPVAVVLSGCAFAGAHLTPGEFPQLFALGIILGFSYAQTRNLACPMLIHCIWNSGVVLVLTLLRLQGFNIQELL